MALLTIAPDRDAMAARAAEHITSLIEHAIRERGSVTVALTGGLTSQAVYARLADVSDRWRSRIQWPSVHLFWGDERHVPPDHRDSNFRLARTALIDHVPVPPRQVHRMRGEIEDAKAAAAAYDTALRQGFEVAGRPDLTFDVVLLGVGDDAHIASIFPGSPLLELPERGGDTRGDARVAAVWVPKLKAWRLTLTPQALLDSRAIVILVAGEEKSQAAHAALEAATDLRKYPAQLLRTHGQRVHWFIDQAAASRLHGAQPS